MIIIQDTREKKDHCWDFSFFGHQVERSKLDTGDYSIKGAEKLVCIERKKSTSEIAINLGFKWKQFNNELLRMCLMPHKLILCEFPEEYLSFFPRKSGVPENKWETIRMSAGFIKSRFLSIPDTYGINIIFSSSKEQAEQIAVQFLENAAKELNV